MGAHNGSGKSIFIKLLAEQIAATSGVITLDEKNRFYLIK